MCSRAKDGDTFRVSESTNGHALKIFQALARNKRERIEANRSISDMAIFKEACLQTCEKLAEVGECDCTEPGNRHVVCACKLMRGFNRGPGPNPELICAVDNCVESRLGHLPAIAIAGETCKDEIKNAIVAAHVLILVAALSIGAHAQWFFVHVRGAQVLQDL